MVLPSCSAEPDNGGAEWAAEVMPWMDQFDIDVRRHGGIGAIPFLSEDVVVDIRTVGSPGLLLKGVDPAVSHFDALNSGLQPVAERLTFSDSPYIDSNGLVLPSEFDRSVQPGVSPPLPGYGVLFLDIGPTGIERYQVLPSTDWWVDKDQTGRTEPADVASAVTDMWTDAWTNDDEARLRDLYAADAVLNDEIAGVAVSGQHAIVDQWMLAPTTTWSLVSRGDTPAVYLWSPSLREHGHDTAALAVLAQLDGSAEDGCPGEVAVWWELDANGRITHERRFRSVRDTRRCESSSEELPTGWWSNRRPPGAGVVAPAEDLTTATERISEGGVTVEIRNGTPSLAALVGWSLARFDLAGLPLPAADSVTFTKYTDYCSEVQGRTIRLPDQDPLTGRPLEGGWRIVLCLGEDDVYVDDSGSEPSTRARFVVLHELAHVWIAQNLDDLRRDHLIEWLEVPTWNDRQFDWAQRGAEWAANFIAWGLMDVELPLFELGNPPLEWKFDGFQLLTGRRPLQPDPSVGER